MRLSLLWSTGCYPPGEVEVSIRLKVLMFVWFRFLLLVVVVSLDLEESIGSPVAWEQLQGLGGE